MRQGAALFLVSLAALLAAPPAHAAAPKDAQAEKATKEALDVDFLETKFDRAEKKLRAAIDACGADKCTPSVKAQAYVALGVVLAGGKKELEDAREAFVEALTLDKNAKPDPDVVSAEVTYAFDQARKQLKLDAAAPAGPAAPSGQGMAHTPPAEQRLDTPVPLYAQLAPELLDDAKKVTVTYLAPGASDWKTLLLKKLGERGYGINVPCGDIKAEGELRYFISVLDEQGAIITAAGTRDKPLVTAIKQRIEGSPPSWPGFAPPDVCVKVEKGPNQCLDDNQCNAGYSCVRGECTQAPEKSPDEPAGPFRNWVTLSFGPDIAMFSGENVCVPAQQDGQNFVCVREDGSRYAGVPTPNIANNVNAGLALSTLRLSAGYERLFLDNILAGARVGFAFRIESDDDAVFMPFGGELRGSYFIGRKPFERLGARPFVTLAFGFGQFDTPVNVEVLEDGVACGAANPSDINSPCTRPTDLRRNVGPEERLQTLTAYKQAGRAFVAAGGGLQYAPLDRVAINIGVRAGVTFPVAVFVLTPEFSITTGF
ncbi:hypothetical protein [Polyangium aurulentum]|uniref:hypothetical protein n=1 Tax=Polyangium aurulentum TaxID=2567896 RepID=UPI0010AE20A2|nr:hypothetical protein [Polyangium aurulentum]UQA60065.1 hypothetical protein E8A73_006145 [Polyangium aurulentum]